eukprot:scaffold7458_cov60-Attheya_sp.AAC.3
MEKDKEFIDDEEESITGTTAKKKVVCQMAGRKFLYAHVPQFLTDLEQVELTTSVLERCKLQNNDNFLLTYDDSGTSSCSLELGLVPPCGGDMEPALPLAVSHARRAFSLIQSILLLQQQSKKDKVTTTPSGHDVGIRTRTMDPTNSTTAEMAVLKDLASSSCLTGIALLYGPKGCMPAHYDAPTQPLQRMELLVLLSLGSTTVFTCNKTDEPLHLFSGDALVMDSMAVLHGVQQIIPHPSSPVSHLLPPNSRLGVLLWQGRTSTPSKETTTTANNRMEPDDMEIPDGMGSLLFGDDSDSDSDSD